MLSTGPAPPHTDPPPQGPARSAGGRESLRCRNVPSPLAGEGQGEGAVSRDELPTIAILLCRATKTLRAAGVDNPRAEARLLLAHALNVEPATLLARAHDPADMPAFDLLVARRAAREPMAYILGTREFWGMRFRVSPATLVPRPESETLVEAALDHFPDRGAVTRVLDLGTGTGCLLCAALAEFPDATGIGIDISLAALEVARANAQALGLAGRAWFRDGNWLSGESEQFDLVLANPPYIAASDIVGLAPELAHEPRAALVAGDDGLDAYRAIMPGLPGILRPAGVAVLELGLGQGDHVATLAQKAGLRVVTIRHDLARIPRAIVVAAA